jgi:hypothetical protein
MVARLCTVEFGYDRGWRSDGFDRDSPEQCHCDCIVASEKKGKGLIEMRAMVLNALGLLRDKPTPLQLANLPDPIAGEGEILIKVNSCGVCHTEMDEIEGRTPPPKLPIIRGHQVVGRVVALGSRTSAFQLGDRVGVAWIYSACGRCHFCLGENWCPFNFPVDK